MWERSHAYCQFVLVSITHDPSSSNRCLPNERELLHWQATAFEDLSPKSWCGSFQVGSSWKLNGFTFTTDNHQRQKIDVPKKKASSLSAITFGHLNNDFKLPTGFISRLIKIYSICMHMQHIQPPGSNLSSLWSRRSLKCTYLPLNFRFLTEPVLKAIERVAAVLRS